MVDDHTSIGASEAWGCLFCPCCMVEVDPHGTVEEPAEIIPFLPETGYVIKDLRTGDVVETDRVGFHMAIEHHSSAGLDVEKNDKDIRPYSCRRAISIRLRR